MGPRSPETPTAALKHTADKSPPPKPHAEVAKAISATVPALVSFAEVCTDAPSCVKVAILEPLPLQESIA